MPCSHLIDSYKLEYTGYQKGPFESKGYSYDGYAPQGSLNALINKDLYEITVQGWREREPELAHDYETHSHRLSLSANCAIDNDRFLKISKWTQSYSYSLAKIMAHKDYPSIQAVGYEAAHYWVESYVDAMCYGDHTKGYVSSHETAHPTRGLSWGQILKAGWMNDLYTFTQEVGENWSEYFNHPGDWCLDQRTINFGNRSRSPDVGFYGFVLWLLTRNRQIGYVTGYSSINAFVPHDVKVRVLREIFDRFEVILDTKIICPKTEGGVIYSMLRDSFLSGYNLVHFDVSGMELITPSLIQGRMTNLDFGLGSVVGYLNMIPELLSGVGPTSDFDMIAHLILLCILLSGKKKPLYIIILGDDCTLVYDGPSPIDNHPLYERQIMDDKLCRTLGLVTREWVHPVGLHFTIDRADKRIPLVDNWGRWINNTMTMPERKAIAEFFTGSLNGEPVHEILEKAPVYDFVYSPKEMVLLQANLISEDDRVINVSSRPLPVKA
jgi:hypothetical protein